jgi:hypothetical protein
MKRTFIIATLAVAPVLAACESRVYDPAKCDYEQAQTVEAIIRPVERAEWIDYNDDGVVVLCMWTGMAG